MTPNEAIWCEALKDGIFNPTTPQISLLKQPNKTFPKKKTDMKQS